MPLDDFYVASFTGRLDARGLQRAVEHWTRLDPDYAVCNVGKEQSPIDIQDAEKADLAILRFDSKSGPLKYLVNNGHTIRVNYHDAPGTGNLLYVGDKRYQLTQFHFHRPSEEYIHGKPFDMVAHLMYKSGDGEVAGVAVLLTAGGANATIRQLWEHMTKKAGSGGRMFGDFYPILVLGGELKHLITRVASKGAEFELIASLVP